MMAMRICAVLEQELHNSCVAFLTGPIQRLTAISVDICPVLEEDLHHVSVTLMRGPGNRSTTIVARRVHVGTMLDKELGDVRVATLCCELQGFIQTSAPMLH